LGTIPLNEGVAFAEQMTGEEEFNLIFSLYFPPPSRLTPCHLLKEEDGATLGGKSPPPKDYLNPVFLQNLRYIVGFHSEKAEKTYI
jgi:hypothetical protein